MYMKSDLPDKDANICDYHYAILDRIFLLKEQIEPGKARVHKTLDEVYYLVKQSIQAGHSMESRLEQYYMMITGAGFERKK